MALLEQGLSPNLILVMSLYVSKLNSFENLNAERTGLLLKGGEANLLLLHFPGHL